MGKLKSIKFLMIAYFTTIIAIGMLFTGITLYQKFNETAKKYASQSVDELASQVKYSVDTYTRNMMDVSNTLYYKIIKNQNITNNTFTPQMSVIQTTNNNIANLAIFKSTGELIAASKYSKIMETTDVTNETWFENAMEIPENIHFTSPHKQNLFKGDDAWVISLSRVVSLNEDGEIIQGVLLVDMNLKGIKNICDPIAEGKTGDIYILTPDGGLVYGNKGTLLNQINTNSIENLREGIQVIEGENVILTVKTAGYTGWKIVGVWQLDKVLMTFEEVKDFLILVLLVGIAMCILGTLYISSRLSSPLYRLQKSMKLVEQGNFDIRVEENGEYVVSELSKTFNKMVLRIRELMDEIVKEQDHKRKNEIEILQSQINPHFLYNTLDSVIWLVEDEKVEEATQMITALSRFFRISISSGRNIITVKEELEHARNYLAIQKIRYKNKFTYDIVGEEKVLNAKTIKLLLQPIIENALYHGIEYIHYEGHILIHAYQENDSLIYKIEDNGIGMREETRQRLFDESFNVITKGSGVGVKNVNKRIQLYYGMDYGMKVESELEEGTTIWIKIPLLYE
ncbi:MAG: sensor histidine kinase [Cellulosilyticaceae bacterium]